MMALCDYLHCYMQVQRLSAEIESLKPRAVLAEEVPGLRLNNQRLTEDNQHLTTELQQVQKQMSEQREAASRKDAALARLSHDKTAIDATLTTLQVLIKYVLDIGKHS